MNNCLDAAFLISENEDKASGNYISRYIIISVYIVRAQTSTMKSEEVDPHMPNILFFTAVCLSPGF